MNLSKYSTLLKVDEDTYLFINSRTGAVDVVDEDVVTLLRGDLSQIDPSIAGFLTERGHITALSPDEELDQIEAFYTTIHARSSLRKQVTIIPTYKCNLRCTYCWEKGLYLKGKNWIEKTLSFEDVDYLFTALGKLDKEVREKEPLTYFGGEPLLPENMELIQYIVKEGTKRGYTHFFVTNGTHIPYYLSLLKQCPLRGIQVTLDGPQKIHDSRRKGPKNEGSFDAIVEGIELLRENKIQTNIRVSVDKFNIDSLPDVAAFVKEQGWHKDSSIVLYLAPVFLYREEGYSESYARGAAIENIVSLLNKDYVWEVFKKGVKDFHPLEFVLKGGTWSPQPYACAAHSNQLIFDCHGKIYTCLKAAGEKEHCVGHFIPRLEFNKIYEDWMHRTVLTIPECRSCDYAFLCGGGCAYAAYNERKTLFAPMCEDTKKILEEYIPFYYRKFVKEKAE